MRSLRITPHAGSVDMPAPAPAPGAAGGNGEANIRSLAPTDLQFIKEKLAVKPENDLVRITEFAIFCEGWVPALNAIRLLCREWLCNEPRLLHGFLSRKQTEDMLEDKADGTFLLRFRCVMGTGAGRMTQWGFCGSIFRWVVRRYVA
jgi:hypothetical protein